MVDYLFCINSNSKINPGKPESKVSKDQPYHEWGSDSLWIVQIEGRKSVTVISSCGSDFPVPVGNDCTVSFQSNYKDMTKYGKVIGYVSPDNEKYGEVPTTAQTCYRMK